VGLPVTGVERSSGENQSSGHTWCVGLGNTRQELSGNCPSRITALSYLPFLVYQRSHLGAF